MSFEQSLSILDDIEQEINREARSLSINLLTGLTKVSPVDTGRARGNWFASTTSTNRSVDNNRRASEAVISGISEIGKAKQINYPNITISNNLPYIEKLNEGHSTQAPVKFVESEIDRVVNARKLNG